MNRHPILIIILILGIGLFNPGAAFSASANILMIVDTPGNPNASDQAIRAYLESTGLTVFYADEDDPDYNPAITANNIDAVYVSTSAGSGALGDKTRDLTVGVVMANIPSWDNQLLNCSGSSTQTDGTDVNLVDNSHYITQPLGTGVFAAYSGTGSLGWGDTLGAGAQVLIQMAGQPTQAALVVYDTNSELCDTSSAPSRRVGIYTDDDFSLWTTTTQTLVLRSLLWAAGSGASIPAVTSAIAEISPNDATTGATAKAFTYDILVTLGIADSGVDREEITVPGTYGAPTVSNVLVGGTPVAYTNNTAGNLISVDLTAKVVSSDTITVLFNANAPGAPDAGLDFISTVDDSGTADAAQATTEGDADGDAPDNNSWTVTTANPAYTVNYRSIGTNAAVLYSAGTASITANSSTVTFSGATLPTNIGVGDELVIGTTTFYILSRDTASQVTVQEIAVSSLSNQIYSISRAYNTLPSWEDDRDGDLVGENRREVGVAYADGTFTQFVAIDDSTTDSTHYMTLTVAEGQRHNGTAGTGVIFDGGNTSAGFRASDDYTRFEWFELIRTGGSDGRAAANVENATNVTFDHLLIHDYITGDASYGIKGSANSSFTARNCIIYDGQSTGIRLNQATAAAIVENCTVYGITGRGIDEDAGTLTVRNSISMGNTSDDFRGGTQSYNLSEDTSATGTGSITGKDPDLQFVNNTAGDEANWDFHLIAGSDAIDAGTDLSGSFTGDIDGDTRPISTQWEIGADETNAPAGAGDTISGNVYEDVNGDANMADQVARDNVTVALFRDGGDNLPDSSDDTYVSSTTTSGGGAYAFTGLTPATYWVAVDSRTIIPRGGYNGGFALGDVWAEQTYGTAGARCDNGAGGTDVLGAAGACYGGQDNNTSDNITAPITVADLATAEHVTRIVLSANATGVNFGFSFNAVVTERDDVDDDGSANRTIQGSLRQFLQNSNAIDNTIDGTPTSVFRMPANEAGGSGEFTIAPQAALGGLPTIVDPVIIDGYTQTGAQANTVAAPGAPDAILLLELDGSGAGAAVDGLSIAAGNSTVRGLVINRFEEDGIEVTINGNNTISGNYIGTDVSGTLDRGNILRGIIIYGSDNNVIGGTNPADRNLIAGNDREGLNIRDGSAANTVRGNYIGTSAGGDAPLGNGWEGIQLWDAGAGNIIGGTASGAGNLVSNNGRSGIRFDGATITGTLIQGNIIGLNAAGDAPLPNAEDGVYISASGNNNVVGGSDASYRNVISGNLGNGVRMTGNSNYVDVRWNFIGINTAGTATVGNTLDGILVEGGSDHTDIYNNWIGANLGNGIQVTGAGSNTTYIRLNYIGTDSTWTRDFGNGGHGIYLLNGVMDTRIGNNSMAGGVNTVFNNAGDGIRVEGATTTFNYVQITRTFNNGGLGINLIGGTEDGFGVTANDPLDGDSGANNLQNYASITTSSSNGTNVSLNWSLNTLANQSNRYVLFFYLSSGADPSGSGEGRRYLGLRANVSTDAGGNASGAELFIPLATNDLGVGPVTLGSVVTVSTWDQLSGDGSEYSAAFPVTVTGNTDISGTIFEDVNYGGGVERNLAAAQAAAGAFSIERDNVTVELYDAAGTYLNNTATAVDGTYSFSGLTAANYIVRLVNSTVTSTRVGSDGSEIAVQTFRIDGDGEAAGTGANKVGGEQPVDGDAPARAAGQTLADLQAPANQYTQSIVTVDASGGDVTGVDFGFNFDTIVNTNDDDQGSLRQFILNANLLTDNAALAQTGRTAAVENSIFMIPGAADALGRPADPKENFGGNTNGAFTIQPQTVLPTINDPVVLDGYTQADAQANTVAAPGSFDGNLLIELDGSLFGSGTNGLTIGAAGNSTVRGLVINRFPGADSAGIRLLNSPTNRIEGNYIGTNVAGTAAAGNHDGIRIDTTSNTTIGGTTAATRNLIAGNNDDNLDIKNSSGVLIQGNNVGIDVNGTTALGGEEGILLDDTTGSTVGGTTANMRNLISGNEWGVRLDNNSTGNAVGSRKNPELIFIVLKSSLDDENQSLFIVYD